MRKISQLVISSLALISGSVYGAEKLKFEVLTGNDKACIELASDLSENVKLETLTAPAVHKAGTKLKFEISLSKTKKLNGEQWETDYSYVNLNSIISKPYTKFIHYNPKESLKDFFFEDSTTATFHIETDIAKNIGGKAVHRLSFTLMKPKSDYCNVGTNFTTTLDIQSDSVDIIPPLVRSIVYDKTSYHPGDRATVTFKFTESLKTPTSDHIEFTNRAIVRGEPGRSIPKYGETHTLQIISETVYAFTFDVPKDTKQGSYHPEYFNRFDRVDNFEDVIGGEDAYEKQVAETSPLVVTTEEYTRVDKDIQDYQAAIKTRQDKFDHLTVEPKNKEWVKAKLNHMYDIDQYTRNYLNIPKVRNYSEDETKYFWAVFAPMWVNLDFRNTEDLKGLISYWYWFNISVFGAQADNEAWLIIQHADHDTDFQKQTLVKLENLYPKAETSPKNYAYLYDRVAASWQKPDLRRPQRYGTQGQCKETGKWEPLPIEDRDNVDNRRKEVGLGLLKDYITEISKVCL